MPPLVERVNHILSVRRVVAEPSLGIAVVGELDVSNAADLRTLLERWVAGTPDQRCVSIDASELTFVDSSGVQALLALHRLLEREGRGLEIRDVTPVVRLALDTLGLSGLLGVVDERGPGGGPAT